MLKPEWPTGRLWPAIRHLAGLAQPRLCQPARDRIRRPCAHAEQTVRFRCAGDNGCNYGACFNPLTVDSFHTRCVHDASFCSTMEQYYTAEQVPPAFTPVAPRHSPHTAPLLNPAALSDPQVLEYGLSCKCMDILDYPSTIGVCNNAGFYSPMAIASDCPATSVPGPVCNSIGGLYTAGNPVVAAFSACDLTCNHLPFNMPANIPKPMAYYFMDEGHGRNLKESVTQVSDAGQVLFVDAAELGEDVSTSRESHSHQHNLTGPNEPQWVDDEYFGTTIACGNIDEYSHQKDFLALADVDYGASGKWAMSVWYRHEVGVNFEGYQREQVSE